MKVTKLETLKDLILEHKEMAIERFKDGSETPFIIGYSGSKRLVFPLFFRNDDEKEKVLQMVTLGFIALDVKRYTFDSQGYSLAMSTEEESSKAYQKLKEEGKSIKDHPNHVEILMCGAVSHKEKFMQVFEIVTSPDNSKSLKSLNGEDLSEVSGRFTELLPPNEIDPRLKKEIVQHFNTMLKHLPIKVDDIQ